VTEEGITVKILGAGVFFIFLFTPSADHLTAIGFLISLITFCLLLRGPLKSYIFFNLPLILLLFSGFVSLIFSFNKRASLISLLCLSTGMIVFYIITVYMSFKPEKIRSLLLCLIISFSIMVITGLLQFIFNRYNTWMDVEISPGVIEHRGRLTSLFIFPNGFSAYLVMSLPVILGALRIEGTGFLKRIFLIFISLISLVCLVSTYSRAGWIGFAVSIVLMGYLSARKKRVLLLSLLIFSIIGISLFLFLQRETLKSFLFHNYSDQSRQFIWAKSIKMIKDHPLTGIGIGNFYYVYPRYILQGEEKLPEEVSHPWHAHNLFLNIAVEMGLPALCFFLWFIFRLLKEFFCSAEKKGEFNQILYGIISGLIGFIIFNHIDFVMGDLKNGLYLFIVLAFGSGLVKATERKEI